MSKQKPILQQLYEWSMRHQDEYNSENIYQNIDMEKIDWLNNAWSQIFKTNSELMKNILKMLNDPATSPEQSVELLEELAEHMENIDNAQLMRPLDGWNLLHNKYKSSDPKIQAIILHIINEAIKNQDQIQADVLQYFSDVFRQEIRQINQKDKAKYLIRIIAAYICNPNKALEIQKIIDINFIAAFKYAMAGNTDIYEACKSYYTHIITYFQSINEDIPEYNKFIKAVVNEQPANVLASIQYQVKSPEALEENVRIRLKK